MLEQFGLKRFKYCRLGLFILMVLVTHSIVMSADPQYSCCNPAHSILPTAPAGNHCVLNKKGACVIRQKTQDKCTGKEAFETVVSGICQAEVDPANCSPPGPPPPLKVTTVRIYNGSFECGDLFGLPDGKICCQWDYYYPWDYNDQQAVPNCSSTLGSCTAE